jgi:hypothetical protein
MQGPAAQPAYCKHFLLPAMPIKDLPANPSFVIVPLRPFWHLRTDYQDCLALGFETCRRHIAIVVIVDNARIWSPDTKRDLWGCNGVGSLFNACQSAGMNRVANFAERIGNSKDGAGNRFLLVTGSSVTSLRQKLTKVKVSGCGLQHHSYSHDISVPRLSERLKAMQASRPGSHIYNIFWLSLLCKVRKQVTTQQ